MIQLLVDEPNDIVPETAFRSLQGRSISFLSLILTSKKIHPYHSTPCWNVGFLAGRVDLLTEQILNRQADYSSDFGSLAL
eukprot:1358017-Amorphochlora_amoeboformis.AAC.1